MQPTEKHLLSQIKTNNVEAYKYVFDLYYRDMYFFARKFLVNTEVAEEIVRDVLIALWENTDGAWCGTTARARVLSYHIPVNCFFPMN